MWDRPPGLSLEVGRASRPGVTLLSRRTPGFELDPSNRPLTGREPESSSSNSSYATAHPPPAPFRAAGIPSPNPTHEITHPPAAPLAAAGSVFRRSRFPEASLNSPSQPAPTNPNMCAGNQRQPEPPAVCADQAKAPKPLAESRRALRQPARRPQPCWPIRPAGSGDSGVGGFGDTRWIHGAFSTCRTN